MGLVVRGIVLRSGRILFCHVAKSGLCSHNLSFLMDLSGISKLPERYGRRVRIKAVCVQEFRAVWICL